MSLENLSPRHHLLACMRSRLFFRGNLLDRGQSFPASESRNKRLWDGRKKEVAGHRSLGHIFGALYDWQYNFSDKSSKRGAVNSGGGYDCFLPWLRMQNQWNRQQKNLFLTSIKPRHEQGLSRKVSLDNKVVAFQSLKTEALHVHRRIRKFYFHFIIAHFAPCGSPRSIKKPPFMNVKKFTGPEKGRGGYWVSVATS